MKKIELYLPDAAATKALGAALGRLLRPGQTVLLGGELGTGKTLFTQGAAEALGVDGSKVNSPTFQLLNIYRGSEGREMGHFDLYRLERIDELEVIGFGEYCESGAVCFIEWADCFPDLMPEYHVTVRFTREGQGRRAVIEGKGAAEEAAVAALAREVAACGS